MFYLRAYLGEMHGKSTKWFEQIIFQLDQKQRDQIWRNSLFLKSILAIFEGILKYLAECFTHFGNFLCYLAKFLLMQMAEYLKNIATIWLRWLKWIAIWFWFFA